MRHPARCRPLVRTAGVDAERFRFESREEHDAVRSRPVRLRCSGGQRPLPASRAVPARVARRPAALSPIPQRAPGEGGGGGGDWGPNSATHPAYLEPCALCAARREPDLERRIKMSEQRLHAATRPRCSSAARPRRARRPPASPVRRCRPEKSLTFAESNLCPFVASGETPPHAPFAGAYVGQARLSTWPLSNSIRRPARLSSASLLPLVGAVDDARQTSRQRASSAPAISVSG